MARSMPFRSASSISVLPGYGSISNLSLFLPNALAKEHFDRIDNAPERRRTGKNKDKYEMLPYPGNTLMDEADLKGMLRAMALFIKAPERSRLHAL
ncbi:hypothetical protein CHLRE_12g526210v5 [Chlamydomonas reinhardtii]|uniref:Uncharacterized protein n=1 Tax=Chlamydomonas reinhardtii TaxID=3055 RepID=A0A2K3D4H0_CHLRE|nr:uncharacterized protein CHLRE_12g526210v5 [Chlamydomonas reinhardtii]PNW75428.1 hypothetical protein CHLRE_12g526210v5 [Chlamydomonas reinhardtii]